MAGSLRPVTGRQDTWDLRIYRGSDAWGGRATTTPRSLVPAGPPSGSWLAWWPCGTPRPAPVPEGPVRCGPTTSMTPSRFGTATAGTTCRPRRPATTKASGGSTSRTRSAGAASPPWVPTTSNAIYRSLKAVGLSAATVRQVKAVLHRSCHLAHKWSGGTLPNPAADADQPVWGLDERRGEVRAPSAEEVRRLLCAALADGDSRFACFLRVLAATGMRRGEACALRWSDLDLEGATAKVDESVIAARGGALVKAPKTRASIRRLSIDAATVIALKNLHREQEELAAGCGMALDPDGFVFSVVPGGAVAPHPDAATHAFTRLRRKAGIAADTHLHSLRHCHATALDPVVFEAQKQARLGWSTVQMARHYTDGLADEDRRAADHIGQLLG